MPQINILNVLQGDNQSTIVDKLNYNFDQILSAGGGPQGQQGLIGPTGPIGPQGPQGVQGLQGASGTKWFVQNTTAPASGSIYAGNPALYPTIGDYWLDTGSSNEEIWVFGATGWIDTGIGLAAGSVFQNVMPVTSLVGNTTGIFIAGAATNTKALILSDADITDYVSSASENANYENSKLKISSEDSRQKLISFGRSNFEATGGGTGSTYASYNPSIEWDQSLFTGTGPSYPNSSYFNLTFKNPKGAIGIRSEGNTGGVNIYSKDEITAETVNQNIILTTASIDKGIFNNINPNGGFVEISSLPTVTNQPYPTFYANSTGVGIGIGTGQFKMTGTDSRKLAVYGNVSISKNTGLEAHTGDLFLGNPAEIKNDKGVLFVEGHSFFGTTGSDSPYNSSSYPIFTGPAENLGIYPQVFMASLDYGPVLQIANLSEKIGKYPSSRTVIGGGFYDYNAGNKSSGISDVSQEIFFDSNNTSFPNGLTAAAMSYQHKLSDQFNTADTAPVFSISTFLKTGIITNTNGASRTLIETKNSNSSLRIQANGTGALTLNKLQLGGSNNYGLTVFGQTGTSISPVTIGFNSSAYYGSFLDLNTYSVFNPISNDAINYGRHALSIAGVQTIGTRDPISAFSNSAPASQECAGTVSMLKVHRDLGTSYNYAGGMIGPSVNNYPNGIEITSFENNTLSYSVDANESVALAIGSKRGYIDPKITKGFLVSNNGRNVTINGGCIDLGAHLYIPTPTTIELAISTPGLINTGNIGVTENIRLGGDFLNSNGTTGWQYYPLNWVDNDATVQMSTSDITTFTNWDVWHYGPNIIFCDTGSSGAIQNSRRFIKYKIIGRTVHLAFTISNMEFLGTHEGFAILLPSFLQPATGDITHRAEFKETTSGNYYDNTISTKISTGRASYIDFNPNYDTSAYAKECIVSVAKIPTLKTSPPLQQVWGTTNSSGVPYNVHPNLQNYNLIIRSVTKGVASQSSYISAANPNVNAMGEGAYSSLSRRFFDGSNSFFRPANLNARSMGSYVMGSITYDLD
jgi:hypothetical protein